MSEKITASVDANRVLTVSLNEGFTGEHNAQMLEIDIGPFAQGYDYYILNFDNYRFKGKITSNVISTSQDRPAYIDNGVIYCPLTSQLTCTGRLRVQLEAHKVLEESGEIVRKSSVASLEFKPSIMGEDDMMDSNSPIYALVCELDKRVDALEENEIGDDEAMESFNNTIVELDKRIGVLEENKAGSDEAVESFNNTIAALDKRIGALEENETDDDEAMESFNNTIAELDNRVVELEERESGITEIPVAGEYAHGTVAYDDWSEVITDENGMLRLGYDRINGNNLSVLLVAALMQETANVRFFSTDNSEHASEKALALSQMVLNDEIKRFFFAVWNECDVQYYDENFTVVTMRAKKERLYCYSIEEEAVYVAEYGASGLRKLIVEGG